MTWIPTPLMSGDEIYRNFQDGFGPGGLAASAETVNTLVERYQGRVDQILKLRARMEAAWQGNAAGAADRGLGPLVIEHGLAGRALHVAQDLTSRQVGSFGEAKNAVVPVPPAPGDVDVLAMFVNPDVASTYFEQVALHNQAAQHNVDVMDGYTGASQYNTDGQPTSYGRIADDPTRVDIDVQSGIGGESDVDGGLLRGQEAVPGTEAGGNDTPEAAASAILPTSPESVVDSTRSAVAVPTNTMPTNTVSTHTVSANSFGVPLTEAHDSGSRNRGVNGHAAGGGAMMRGGGLLGGRGGGSNTQPGAPMRPAVLGVGPGRGGVGFAGLPAATGGRKEEDTERKAPAYLEGGDPEELWDTDELTAPPAIGDEDG